MSKDIMARLDNAVSKISKVDALRTFEQKFREINKVDTTFARKEVFVLDRSDSEEPIIIIPISDMHLGSKNCNIKKIEMALQLINEIPNCYTVFLGDQTETATKVSVGLGVYEEEFDLSEQLKRLYKMLKPLAENGKILGMLTGNHEMRVAYATSLNPVELIASELDVPYFGYQGYVSIKVGSQTYHVFMHHGPGGGATPAGKLSSMRALSKVAVADLYLSGHTHGKLYDSDMLMQINDETRTVDPYIRHYVACGSFLEYWGGYAEMKLLAPTLTGVTSIVLSPDEKNIQVIL